MIHFPNEMPLDVDSWSDDKQNGRKYVFHWNGNLGITFNSLLPFQLKKIVNKGIRSTSGCWQVEGVYVLG